MEQANILIKQHIIGIDAASQKFDASWLKDSTKFAYPSKVLENNPTAA
ncbi:hypothetical protein ACKLNO_12005 [Neisseriaceae bacterium B1]